MSDIKTNPRIVTYTYTEINSLSVPHGGRVRIHSGVVLHEYRCVQLLWCCFSAWSHGRPWRCGHTCACWSLPGWPISQSRHICHFFPVCGITRIQGYLALPLNLAQMSWLHSRMLSVWGRVCEGNSFSPHWKWPPLSTHWGCSTRVSEDLQIQDCYSRPVQCY